MWGSSIRGGAATVIVARRQGTQRDREGFRQCSWLRGGGLAVARWETRGRSNCHRPQGQGLHDREGRVDAFYESFHRFKVITRQGGNLFQKSFRRRNWRSEARRQVTQHRGTPTEVGVPVPGGTRVNTGTQKFQGRGSQPALSILSLSFEVMRFLTSARAHEQFLDDDVWW
jgi:hypothetical protein